MILTATIRDEQGAVLCAYTLHPTPHSPRHLVGGDVLELEGITYRVSTVLVAEATEPDHDALPGCWLGI